MAIREILLLGDERLHQLSQPVEACELHGLAPIVDDLHDTMAEFQRIHGWGRAIAAPQIGVHKRIVCMNFGHRLTLLNPVLDRHSDETMEHWEDCMSFPELLVRLRNPVRCRLRYRDLEWEEHEVLAEYDFAELVQHEVDHLDGVLSIDRAIDRRAVVLRRAMPAKDTTLRGTFRELGLWQRGG